MTLLKENKKTWMQKMNCVYHLSNVSLIAVSILMILKLFQEKMIIFDTFSIIYLLAYTIQHYIQITKRIFMCSIYYCLTKIK